MSGKESCNPDEDKFVQLMSKLGGPKGRQTLQASCQAVEDGRYGNSVVQDAKFLFHDLPAHQFSSGETPKPAVTPLVKAPEIPVRGK
jgi:hypothetical protein